MSVGTPTWAAVIGALIRREDLDATSAQWAMGEVMAGNASPAQIAAFAVALRGKGETAAEMSGLAEAMLAAAHRIDVPGPAVDIVGTGGDRSHSVNISTMAALVVAGAGVRVVKHGNRAASSDCGTADVLEELGVALGLTPAQVAAVGADVGITFCFAQVFHPAMRHAAAARREIGVPTSFNFLGPLTNPAQPVAQAIGCADLRMAPVMAQVFAERGASALVFRGDDGLDELTVSTTSSVWRVIDGQVEASTLDPARFAIASAPIEALRGGDRQHNAGVVRALLSGEERGPIRDAVVLNASAALAALDAATGSGGGGGGPGAGGAGAGGAGAGGAGGAGARGALEDAMASGLERAASAIDSGAAADVLDRWVTATQSISS